MTTKSNLATIAYNSTGWDVPINSNTSATNNAFGGVLAVSITAADVTLTSDQAQNMALTLSGTLTGNRTLFIPSGVSGSWVVKNTTTGTYSVTVSNVAGSATTVISQGTSALVFSDGTNVYQANDMGGNPAGTMIQFAGTSAPSGYLWCDGSAVLRTVYARLFTAIGTTWGVGDGSSTFNLPDSQGAFFRGSGSGLNPSTRTVGSYEADDVKPHSHTITDPGHYHVITADSAVGLSGGGRNIAESIFNNSTMNSNSATTGITINNSTGTESRPKNYAVLWCIKT
jgi:microcystin-dependent protein